MLRMACELLPAQRQEVRMTHDGITEDVIGLLNDTNELYQGLMTTV